MTHTKNIARNRLSLGAFGLAVLLSLGAVDANTKKKPPTAYQPTVVVQLGVEDLDRSVKFYTETMGLELEARIDPLRWAKIKTAVPGLTIGLGETPKPNGSGSMSINLAVPDADAARKRLEERGVIFRGPTTEIPGVVRLADFSDPDGNHIRLAGPPKPAAK